ncbi:late cornified envelope protein 6A [Perognathus longimembris pacificus]|uniref:late cornified envelope protein 6A n=1 Tax=Perognathus longimembris pacificus TaxID=214514 RepID=UPI002019B7E3|nr:late cornified envelope protein 6A [Perognathus longimembris pacificus]
MSQQKQPSGEPPSAPKCSPPQCPHTQCLVPCGAPCAAPLSCLPKLPAQCPAHPKRARRQPSCVSGGTTYPCKEEEC